MLSCESHSDICPSGPPPKSSRSESPTPSDAHPYKKGIEIVTTTIQDSCCNDEDPLIPSATELAGTEENTHESTAESAEPESDLKASTN
jgi:hypothetical protein